MKRKKKIQQLFRSSENEKKSLDISILFIYFGQFFEKKIRSTS